MTDRFATYDAAYVLGALSDQDRSDFEGHLQTCPECAASVASMREVSGLLEAVPASVWTEAHAQPEDLPQPPASLLPRLLDEVGAKRRRRRWITATVGGLAAACLVALAIIIPTVVTSGSAPSRGVAMAQVVSTPIRATAHLSDVEAGTKIQLNCSYDVAASSYPGTETYALVVVPRHGAPQQLSTWLTVPGQDTLVSATTSLKKSEISAVQITTLGGPPVLQLNL